MSARPVDDPPQDCRSGAIVGSQPVHQRHRFPLGEIRKLNSVSDVERGSSRVANQVRWSCNPEQTEGQPLDFRLGRSSVETFANPGKKFIGGKRKAADGVNFVHEYHDPAFAHRENHIGQHTHETPHGTELRKTVPAFLNLVFQAKLLTGTFDEPVVPLLGRQILTQTGQVKHSDPRAILAQTRRGSYHD